MKAIVFIAMGIFIFSSNAMAKTSALDKCINSYCDYSCRAVSSCGYLASSQIRSCKSSCKPSAKRTLAAKGSRAVSACRSNNSKFRTLSCLQIGRLLGTGGNGGGTKR